MKKVLIAIAALASMVTVSCNNSPAWEYKVVKIAGNEASNYSAMSFSDPTAQLNKLGNDGWEVVSTYTEVGTVHPNFGNAEYVTGLQPNTRTSVVNFVLKRKL